MSTPVAHRLRSIDDGGALRGFQLVARRGHSAQLDDVLEVRTVRKSCAFESTALQSGRR